MPETPFYVSLKNRATLHISGEDAKSFLQDLITNDMNKIESDKPLYASLLNPQGKFLFDFFIYQSEQDDKAFILDCEAGENAERINALYKKLLMYRLRKAVDITMQEHAQIYAIFGAPEIGLADPRHTEMGTRSFDKPNISEANFEEWDQRRIKLTIPDGSRDLIVDKSTMDEAHMDQLNAIDYKKGCYVGQELTARMHYRGLGKKHLQSVKVSELPEGAVLRSSCGDIGLALVKNKA